MSICPSSGGFMQIKKWWSKKWTILVSENLQKTVLPQFGTAMVSQMNHIPLLNRSLKGLVSQMKKPLEVPTAKQPKS
jgi:hypothetical protein